MARWKGKYQLPFNCLRFLLLGELSSRVELPLSNAFLYCCLTCSTTDVTIYSWAWLRKLKSTLKLKITVTFELTTIYLANIFWGRLLKKKKKWCKQIKETKSKWEVEEQWETKGGNWGCVSALREEIQMVDISSDS